MAAAKLVTLAASAVLVAVLLVAPPAEAAVYKVGDSSGWTTIGNVDYKQWAATKTFRLGDVIVFQYNSQFHNVMQVTHAAFQACNASSPKATHTTGNDSITITTRGHHFFLCGVPGHCQSGQKVDINVPRVASSVSSIAPSPSVSSSPGKPSAMAPGPSSAAAVPTAVLRKGLLSVVAAVFAVVLVG